mgnify:CR=1 FL=1
MFYPECQCSAWFYRLSEWNLISKSLFLSFRSKYNDFSGWNINWTRECGITALHSETGIDKEMWLNWKFLKFESFCNEFFGLGTSSFEVCEQIDELRVFSVCITPYDHLLLIYTLTSIKRRCNRRKNCRCRHARFTDHIKWYCMKYLCFLGTY